MPKNPMTLVADLEPGERSFSLTMFAYLFLVIQPLLLLGVAAFGLFDFWFNFRHLSDKREELQ